MNKFIYLLLLSTLFSCQKSSYKLEKTAAINFPHYSKSFSMVERQESNKTEEKLTTSIRKHLIKSKWIYDNENPDFYVNVSYDHRYESVHLSILEANGLKCIWQGKVMDLPRSTGDYQMDRIVYSAFGK